MRCAAGQIGRLDELPRERRTIALVPALCVGTGKPTLCVKRCKSA